METFLQSEQGGNLTKKEMVDFWKGEKSICALSYFWNTPTPIKPTPSYIPASKKNKQLRNNKKETTKGSAVKMVVAMAQLIPILHMYHTGI